MKVSERAVLKVLDSFSSGFFPMGVLKQRSAFEEKKALQTYMYTCL